MEYPSSDEPGAKIWLPYLESADKYDRDLVEGWRDDMDSLLIFAALFSAVVTTFVVDSYRSLQRDQTMEAVSVLVQISKQLANGTQNTAFEPTPFVTPTSAVAVNICWFMSLAFSLSCALAAVMVRQWARHYLRLPRSLSATSERARMRQYLFENMVTWKLEFIVEVIPALLHISLILFFIGLLLFLHFLNSVVALCLFCFCAVGGVAYALLTIIPVVFPGSPYKTPFSRFPALVALVLWTAICSVVACITALCLSAIRFTHRSLNIPKPPPSSYWAFDRVQQIADFFGTIAIGGIGLLRKFAHIPRNIPSDAQLTQLLSLDGAERRRQLAHRKPGTRDARALRWSMAYSRNDTDFVTIVASIPGFVKSFGRFTPDAIETGDKLYGAQTLLWQTGVILRISKLLRSCVDANGAIKTGMRSVAVSCMHALHWMARCPAASPWGQEIETMPRINLTEPNAVAAYEYRLLEPWIAIDRDDPADGENCEVFR
ncbi:hypothetical protein BD410DRAFT_602908 [Rickenella mellea]|uniref:DUF6535 domain-containing protein n=1 Tax=Rickenella mellea TaxID=50990 RepID=A0A4Y7QEX9_9AGAM|nr:hypothetical protein BD410DRAFT_602908 [Rickenella mellea]